MGNVTWHNKLCNPSKEELQIIQSGHRAIPSRLATRINIASVASDELLFFRILRNLSSFVSHTQQTLQLVWQRLTSQRAARSAAQSVHAGVKYKAPFVEEKLWTSGSESVRLKERKRCAQDLGTMKHVGKCFPKVRNVDWFPNCFSRWPLCRLFCWFRPPNPPYLRPRV